MNCPKCGAQLTAGSGLLRRLWLSIGTSAAACRARRNLLVFRRPTAFTSTKIRAARAAVTSMKCCISLRFRWR